MERIEGRKRRGTDILAILCKMKYINSNYPLVGDLRILCTYILTGTLLIHELQR